MACVLLGTVKDNDEIDSYANFDASTDLCEQCAETGYAVLQKNIMMLNVMKNYLKGD